MKINKKSFMHYCYIFIYVIAILIIANKIRKNDKFTIDLLGKDFSANDEILIKEDNNYYLSYSFIKENIDNSIYFDTVSRKVVISSDTAFVKAKVNDNIITDNFTEKQLDSKAVIEKSDKYILLEVLEQAYGFETSICNNMLYIYEKNSFDCLLKMNNVKVYKEANSKSKVVGYINKKDKITGISENSNYVLVKINDKDVGYIAKNMLNYKKISNENGSQEIQKSTYIFADNTNKYIDKNLALDGILLNMFDVNKISGEVSTKNINKAFITDAKNKGYKVYGIVTNGYNLSGFNKATTSQILADETKRITVINDLINNMNQYKLDGLVIDFRMLKETDQGNYEQFVKEFNSLNEKETILSIDANEYKKYISAINYSDFSIINMYGLRDLNSSVAGSVSEIKWMENIINETLKTARKNKLVICIPAYSILWTEKNSIVVNSEIYSLDAIEDYILKNSLDKKYNENTKQNYIELKKGSLVYKMWVEDETSIKNRIAIIKDNDLKGLAIYKLGYETRKTIDLINTIK